MSRFKPLKANPQVTKSASTSFIFDEKVKAIWGRDRSWLDETPPHTVSSDQDDNESSTNEGNTP